MTMRNFKKLFFKQFLTYLRDLRSLSLVDSVKLEKNPFSITTSTHHFQMIYLKHMQQLMLKKSKIKI